MATVTVTVTRGDHIADFNAVFSELGQAYMTAALNVVQGTVQRNSPVNTGQYRSSIANQVQAQGALEIKGSVFSQDDPIKVNVIEEGRRAGARFPPVDVITRWVQLKLRPPANKLRQVAFLVGRKIAQQGIPGKHVFQKSFTETQPEVQRILSDDLSAALAKRL